jgi:hypothetical protein
MTKGVLVVFHRWDAVIELRSSSETAFDLNGFSHAGRIFIHLKSSSVAIPIFLREFSSEVIYPLVFLVES